MNINEHQKKGCDKVVDSKRNPLKLSCNHHQETQQKVCVPLFMIQTSTLFPTTHLENSCKETKWCSISFTILIHCNTFTFTTNF
jgi:hypothetical protein